MKSKIITISFCFIIFSFLIANILIKDSDISIVERRKLTQFPTISYKSIMSKTFMDEFENYTLDQFLFREQFRKIKSFYELNILNKLDNNKIYTKDDMIFKIEYPLNEKSVFDFSSKLNKVYDKYLKGMNVYYSIIPDKNYYVDDNYLKFDYNKLFSLVNENVENMKYINIIDDLSIDSFYRTDTHFKQNKLDKVLETLSNNMNFKYINSGYKENTYSPFYGVYYNQAGINVEPDTITYLTNDVIDNAIVTNYENKEHNKVYDLDKLGKMDSYDVFLSGATPLITIENKLSSNDKELIIFRDSFGSTLAPLLIESYSKITLIDLRYINLNYLSDLVEFNDQDVLFIYNTMIINNSGSLKVD